MTVALYFVITPMFQAPDWCLEIYNDHGRQKEDKILVPCDEYEDGTIRYSNAPKFIPLVTASVDVVCLLCLCVFRCFKRTWRKLSRGDRCRDYVFSLTILICAADSVRGAITCRYPYINNLLRPTVCVIFFSSVSTNLKSVLFDFRESLVILTCIFVYLLYFAAVGMFIFEGTTTGFASFSSLGESYY